ncbi:transposable element Tc3 transposase [Trichonephila clavipes]|nr:transposable element Tc3 transposase [Trichonephila clavipes]
MQSTGNHQKARIVRRNDKSVREGYIRNGGKEVKLFTRALKTFKGNDGIVMAQRIVYVVYILDDWNVYVPSWKYPRNLESPRVSSPGFCNESKIMVMFSLQSNSVRTLIWRAPGTRYHQENTIERHHYGGAGWLVWGGIILGSRNDLHVQNVTMTGHIYRCASHEQHVRLFRGAMGAEFLFMDD